VVGGAWVKKPDELLDVLAARGSRQLISGCKIFDPNYILRGIFIGYFTAPFYLREGYGT
jgi:RimJ/RimL family protein N-acetyltransferase